MSRPQYVIEHMEEDDPSAPSVFPHWALLEYRHMLHHVGPGSTVHFTSLSHASLESLRTSLSLGSNEPRAEFQLHTASITTLMAERGVPHSKVCLLDPKSPFAVSITDAGMVSSTTKPAEAGGPFEYFLFGGILGDDPPRDRTSSLRQLGFPSRHLGSIQMTTDTALGVTKRCVENLLLLDLSDTQEQEKEWGDAEKAKGKLHWVDHPELKFGRGESVEMPFRYLIDERRGEGEPLMPEGMRELIRDDLGRSFEF
ncbi:Protein arginine N-methyltransferase SFM1 [Pseudozyma hubeiensis]|nr:Protein arginine N-methyltransferase SFM1 [Pseudozyma hubeiensis]